MGTGSPNQEIRVRPKVKVVQISPHGVWSIRDWPVIDENTLRVNNKLAVGTAFRPPTTQIVSRHTQKQRMRFTSSLLFLRLISDEEREALRKLRRRPSATPKLSSTSIT